MVLMQVADRDGGPKQIKIIFLLLSTQKLEKHIITNNPSIF